MSEWAGPLYAIPGVAEADASSIPVILLTSDIPLSGEGKKTITELNCQKLFETVTKWSSQVKHVDQLPQVIRRAFRIATSGRPGAVHLALPQEVVTQEFTDEICEIYSESDCQSYPAYRTRGSRRTLEAALRYSSIRKYAPPIAFSVVANARATVASSGYAIACERCFASACS